MTKILLYPDVKNPEDMADILSRMSWHFSPYLENVEALTIFSAVSRKRAFELEAPYYLDPIASPSRSTEGFQKAIDVRTNRGLELRDWKAEFKAHDILIVWRIPTLYTNKRLKPPAFQALDEISKVLPDGIRMVVADRDFRPSEASLLLSEGLRAHGDLESMSREHHARFLDFAGTINKDTCHILGTGPSLSELENYDLSKGDVISCNSLVINDELMARLNPKAICAADPIFHAGPSSYAAAFRAELIAKMDEYDFHLFVPQRDYLIYFHCVPERHHERIIAVPLGADGLNLDLKSEFRVEPLPNVLTLLMFPIGASCYENLTISGCDGRPLSENQYFWGHHKASQINDKMEDIKKAHPGFFNISYDDYYERHCDQVEYLCQTFESSGGTVSGLTASFVPAFRKRGSADPLRPARIPATDAPLTILSLNPDLSDNVGHFWNYEAKLAPEFKGRGIAYRVAANGTMLDNFDVKIEDDGTIINDDIVVDPVLMTNSFTLANRIGAKPYDVKAITAQTMYEYEQAIDRARAAADGKVLVYLYTGSLEHLEILYKVLFDRPEVCAVVNLFWTKVLDVWQPQFAQKFGWLLQQLDQDPRLHATAMTAHQARAIKARTGVSLDVARHPSPLIGDKKAVDLIERKTSVKAKKKLSVFFPSANRVEKGSTILGKIAEHLAVMLHDHDFELIFRSDPAAQGDVKALKAASGGYRVLEGNIEEDTFIAELSSADAVVLPYLPPDFADRTSGLTIDAAFAGTPVVVMAGTWLAECARDYNLGCVVDVPDPHSIAKATFDLITGKNSEAINIKEGAKRYFAGNSWVKLADEVSKGARIPATLLWNEKAGEKMEALNETVSPLLGEVGSDAEGSMHLPQILEAFVKKRKFTGIRVIGFGDENFLTQLSRIKKPVSVIGTNPYLAGRLLGQPKSKLKKLSADLVDEKTLLKSYGGVLAGEPKPNTIACLNVTKARYGKLKKELNLELYQALAIGFKGAIGQQASALSQTCANWLKKAGFDVILIEHWYRPNQDGQGPVRRAVSYPYMNALPYAPTTILAFKRDIPVREQKSILKMNSENCGYVEHNTLEMLTSKLWQNAQPASQSEVAITIAAPGGKNWKLEGFKKVETLSDGFVKLAESSTFRVHRATVPFQAGQGQPLTVECDIMAIKTRFAVLWITNENFQPIAEATFDVSIGKLISVRMPSSLIVGEVFGGIAKLSDENGRSSHIWLSVPKLNTDQKMFANVVTRATASGSMQYKGTSERLLALRNFSVTYKNTPSIFEEKGKVLPKLEEPKSVQEMPEEEQTMVQDTPEFEDIKLNADEEDQSTLTSTNMAPLPFKPEANLHALGVVEPDSYKMGWKNNGQSKILSSENGLVLDRNGAGHSDQCFTTLGLDPRREYELVFNVSHVEPRFIIQINHRPIIDATKTGIYSVVVAPRLSQARVDIKAVDSAYANIDFLEISLNSREFRLN